MIGTPVNIMERPILNIPKGSITELIEYFQNDFFPNITEEESDFIESVLRWDNDIRGAFLIAKSFFEDKEF